MVPLLLILSSCNTEPKILENDQTVEKYFNEEEIEELTSLLNTFDSIMVGTGKINKKTISTYKERINWTLDKAQKTGSCCEFLIPSDAILDILAPLSDQTFSKLFSVTRIFYNGKVQIAFSPRTLDTDSNLRKFIKEIDDESVKEYFEMITTVGSIGLNLTYTFLPQFDLADPKQRLLIALDFISMTAKYHLEEQAIIDIARQKSNLEEVYY
jgi:hypothetical protein